MNQEIRDIHGQPDNLQRSVNSVKTLVLDVEKEMKRRFGGVEERLDAHDQRLSGLVMAVKGISDVQEEMLVSQGSILDLLRGIVSGADQEAAP